MSILGVMTLVPESFNAQNKWKLRGRLIMEFSPKRGIWENSVNADWIWNFTYSMIMNTVNPRLSPQGSFSSVIFLESWTKTYDSFSTKILIPINFNFFTIININNKFCWCCVLDVVCIRSKRIFLLLGHLFGLTCQSIRYMFA